MSRSCEASLLDTSDDVCDLGLYQQPFIHNWHEDVSTPSVSQSYAPPPQSSGFSLMRPANKSSINKIELLEPHTPFPDNCWISPAADCELREMDKQTLEQQRCVASCPCASYCIHGTWPSELGSASVQTSSWTIEGNDKDLGVPAFFGELDYLLDTSGLSSYSRSFDHNAYPLPEYLMNDLGPVSPVSDVPYTSGLSFASLDTLDNSVSFKAMPTQYSSSAWSNASTWSEIDTDTLSLSEPPYMFPIYEKASNEHDRHIPTPEDIPLPASPGRRRKFGCTHTGCTATFTYSADLNRHTKTVHSSAGKGYRCAYEGCSKAYKIWTRLDSFRKHVKKHSPENIDHLVQNSRRERQGLPVCVVTPNTMYRRGTAGSSSQSSAGRVRHLRAE